MIRRCLLLALCASTLLSIGCGRETAKPEIDDGAWAATSWAGWAYVDGVGDFPFRLRFGNEGTAGLDIAFAELFDVALQEVTIQGDRVSFVWISGSGDRRAFEGRRDAGRIDGNIDWAGAGGEFTLNRSALPIAAEDSAARGLNAGYYLFENGSDVSDDTVWHVQRAGYGESYVRVVRDGRQRVAFPTSNGGFFLGSTLFSPDRVSAEFDAGLVVTSPGLGAEGAGKPVEIERIDEMIETPDGDLRVLVTRRSRRPLGVGLVIAQGSNWETAEDDSFRADNLAALGLTVVTFDKRGHGLSPGERDRPFADTARDVGWVKDWSAERFPSVESWGALGVSRGGWVVPLIPELSRRFDFAVICVGPAVSPFTQEFTARRAMLRRDGVSDEVYALADEYFDALVAFARNSSAEKRENYARLHALALEQLPAEMLGAAAGDSPEWRWWKINGDYDPEAALAALGTPTLALFGADDLSVPVEPNRLLMEEFDRIDGKSDLTFKVLPRVGHDLALGSSVPMWAFDSLGSEGIDEIWQWAVSPR